MPALIISRDMTKKISEPTGAAAAATVVVMMVTARQVFPSDTYLHSINRCLW
jgi:hypothetical protein